MTIAKAVKETVASKQFLWAKKVEKNLFSFFRIITVCPIRVVDNPSGIKVKFKKSIRLWAFIVIILTLLYVLITIILRVFLINVPSSLNIWNESANVFGIIITCLVILIETQFTYQHFADFLFLKQKTENELQTLCHHNRFAAEKFWFVRRYWITLIIFQGITLSVEISNIFRIKDDVLWRFHCGWLIVPITIIRLRCFQHRLYTGTLQLYVKLVRIKIEDCINEININESLARQQKRNSFTMNSKIILSDLNLSMCVFTSIYRMTHLVNKMFGFSLLMNIFEDFIQLLSNLFWIYSKLFYQDLDNLSGFLSERLLQPKTLYN